MVYSYPAICYKQEDEPYVLIMPDINVICEEDTKEQLLNSAQEQLDVYLQCIKEFGAILDKPSDFDKLKTKYKDGECLLIQSTLDIEL